MSPNQFYLNQISGLLPIAGIFFTLISGAGCSTMKSAMGANHETDAPPPIENPFMGLYESGKEGRDALVLRTKKGDRSVEVEFANGGKQLSEFVIPVSPAFEASTSSGRNPASAGNSWDSSYLQRKSGPTDREIARALPKGSPTDDAQRREIEEGLGLRESDEDASHSDRSYLAGIDHVKQLYHNGRFEAGLLEIDEMLRAYPTDPKLYQMRGTLLSRLGYDELAIQAWNQASKLDPSNGSLKKFIDQKDRTQKLKQGAKP